MSKGLIIGGCIVSFAAGGAIGWFLANARYQKLRKEDAVKLQESFQKRMDISNKTEGSSEETSEDISEAKPTESEDVREVFRKDTSIYETEIKRHHYNIPSSKEIDDDDHTIIGEDEIDQIDIYEPLIISEMEYQDMANYDSQTFQYFADGILADVNGALITFDEGRMLFGYDVMCHLSDYNDDAIYIRNDYRKAYYIIYRQETTYREEHRKEV